MKVLQISQSDVIGSRFQNFDLRGPLHAQDVEIRHLVWRKLSDHPDVKEIFDWPGMRDINKRIQKLEERLSVQSMLQVQSYLLPLHPWFKEADAVHYHIIHDGYFSLKALPHLARLKPSVWTWHDPWIMTGHCVYPMECDGWTKGCETCPHLDRPFAMREDKAGSAFERKAQIVKKLDADIVVASQHMRDMAQSSAIGRDARLHTIPFGIDVNKYTPQDGRAARERFGVIKGRTVIGVRAVDSPFKGFDYFLEALDKLETNVPITIIAAHDKGRLDRFAGKHQIIEMGWVNDEESMLDMYRACDLFVMNSTAEAFGMMAIEAMSCAKPVIAFEGTSLPEVAFAPDVGLAVPMRDSTALAGAIKELVEDPQSRERRGNEGRRLALEHYDANLMAERLAGLYGGAVARRTTTRAT